MRLKRITWACLPARRGEHTTSFPVDLGPRRLPAETPARSRQNDLDPQVLTMVLWLSTWRQALRAAFTAVAPDELIGVGQAPRGRDGV
jgi:hypothetical protein